MAGTTAACQICGNHAENRTHVAREMMFGWGGAFRYLECGACGCLQLLEVPPDLARYYPREYHSLKPAGAPKGSGTLPEEVAGLRLTPAARVLDVGCGSGVLLRRLAALGFEQVEGVEPNLDADITYADGVTVHRAYLEGMGLGPWDAIMLHHSFEHMPAPAATLRAIAARLAPEGECLIRIPVAGSWAWRHYGVNWVQLDAPRHLFLHTEASMRALAAQAGLTLRSVRYDSTDFQFWGSERYRAGKPLTAPPSSSVWARRVERWQRLAATRLHRWRGRAAALNRAGQGDSAAFILSR